MTDRQRHTRVLYALLLGIIALLIVVILVLPPLPASDDPVFPRAEGSEDPTGEDASPYSTDSSRSGETPDGGIESGSDESMDMQDPPEGLDAPGDTEATPPGGVRPPKPRLVIVLDDVGYNMQDLRPFLDLPMPLTIAVLPQLAFSEQAARASTRAGKEVILHLPMEALGGQNPGAGTLLTEYSDAQLRDLTRVNLATVPGAVGVNNHMGSKATADTRVMTSVIQELKARSLFFLDSRTNAESVVAAVAGESQLPFLERHVFLDNEQTRDYILDALDQGMNIARRNGYAVMIGHVWTHELAEVLQEFYPAILEDGFEFTTLESLLSEGGSSL